MGVARTGLTSREAATERIPCASARIEAEDRASYYPGAKKIWIKLIVERESRRLVGAQAVGYGDVSKRIDVAATAISSGLTIDDFAQLDLAYAPPFGSLWDPLLVAAQAVMRRMD
jgi:NADPH-dependent 2,4-dienoyl-CoA reductase/sulfur reductase-like enzyme